MSAAPRPFTVLKVYRHMIPVSPASSIWDTPPFTMIVWRYCEQDGTDAIVDASKIEGYAAGTMFCTADDHKISLHEFDVYLACGTGWNRKRIQEAVGI